MRSSTETLIAALRILADDIQSPYGVANAVIAEASDRLQELHDRNAILEKPLSDYEIIDLIPIKQNGWSTKKRFLWFARAIERACGKGATNDFT